MHVSLYAVGRKMPDWVAQGTKEYTRRFPRQWQFRLREFAAAKDSTAELSMEREASAMLSAIPDKSHMVALDGQGSPWSTEALARQLSSWQEQGRDLVFLIGGADGLAKRVLERADQRWSLSPLTFPHPLVRVILVEQLYRAQSLLDNHPYHRA